MRTFMNSVEKMLQNYADEIGIERITLEDLICSHRTLRTWIQESLNEQRERFEQEREYIRNMEMDNTWVRWDDLRQMTMQEIANRLGDYE